MKSTRKQSLIAIVASLAFLAAGWGWSGGGSTTTTRRVPLPPTPGRAASASSITTWQAAIESAAGSLKSDPTKTGLRPGGGRRCEVGDRRIRV